MCAATGVFAAIPSQDLIRNLATDVRGIVLNGRTVPMTVSDGTQTCYLCCPTAAYIDYALDELRHLATRPVLKTVLGGLISAARPLLRASGLDRQVQPNNWLLATNILPDLSSAHIAETTQGLVAQWPKHAVIWRSLNDVVHADLLARFRSCGYAVVPSRQIYLFDARCNDPVVHRDEARDRRLLARTDYSVVAPGDIRPGDFERMAWVYEKLYLDKYTWLNPRYTARFMVQAHEDGWLRFHGLRNDDGVLDGVIALFQQGDTVTAPIVGYDTALPPALGLYRRLMSIAMSHARDSRLLYNMSAGAGAFKRHRGGIPAIEYSVVYNRHLGAPARLASAGVRLILNAIGVPVLKGLEL